MIGDLGFAAEWSKSIRPVSRYEKARPSQVIDIFKILCHLGYQYAETHPLDRPFEHWLDYIMVCTEYRRFYRWPTIFAESRARVDIHAGNLVAIRPTRGDVSAG